MQVFRTLHNGMLRKPPTYLYWLTTKSQKRVQDKQTW